MKTMRWIGAVLLWSGLASAAFAEGEIRLANTVQKVEYFTNEAGEQESRLLEAVQVVPGDELYYVVAFENISADVTVDAGSVVITNPLPDQVQYLPGTALGAGTTITFSADGGQTWGTPATVQAVDVVTRERRTAQPDEYTHIRWVLEPELGPGQAGNVSFRARLR